MKNNVISSEFIMACSISSNEMFLGDINRWEQFYKSMVNDDEFIGIYQDWLLNCNIENPEWGISGDTLVYEDFLDFMGKKLTDGKFINWPTFKRDEQYSNEYFKYVRDGVQKKINYK